MTKTQEQRIESVARKFGCFERNDYRVEEKPFDLPDGWVLVTMGEEKGRTRVFGVSPDGRVAS